METDNKNIISFDLLKIEKGKNKFCKCDPPHYVIDSVNRIVTCVKCGAVIDPFEVLITLCSYEDKFTEYQKNALEKAKTYAEMADKEYHRLIKNKVFKNMDSNYRNNLYPICPNCKEIINPVKITDYGNPKFYENSDK